MEILQVVGYQNSGKTTFITNLLKKCQKKSWKIACLKHHGHDAELSTEQLTKDTGKFFAAGANVTVGVSSDFVEIFASEHIKLHTMLDFFDMYKMDLVIIEGYKHLSYPKVVLLKEGDEQLLDLIQVQFVQYQGQDILPRVFDYLVERIEDDKNS